MAHCIRMGRTASGAKRCKQFSGLGRVKSKGSVCVRKVRGPSGKTRCAQFAGLGRLQGDIRFCEGLKKGRRGWRCTVQDKTNQYADQRAAYESLRGSHGIVRPYRYDTAKARAYRVKRAGGKATRRGRKRA